MDSFFFFPPETPLAPTRSPAGCERFAGGAADGEALMQAKFQAVCERRSGSVSVSGSHDACDALMCRQFSKKITDESWPVETPGFLVSHHFKINTLPLKGAEGAIV